MNKPSKKKARLRRKLTPKGLAQRGARFARCEKITEQERKEVLQLVISCKDFYILNEVKHLLLKEKEKELYFFHT